jgi:hypothetical protein
VRVYTKLDIRQLEVFFLYCKQVPDEGLLRGILTLARKNLASMLEMRLCVPQRGRSAYYS